MTIRIIEIGCDDTPLHEAFFDHVAGVFDGIDFRRWSELGGWSERYRVTALAEDGQILSTVAVSRMRLALRRGGETADPAPQPALQLGAVATRADRRGRGHAATLLRRVLASADLAGLPVLLFANPSVTEFYPRFGFERLRPQRAWVTGDFSPGAGSTRAFDPARAADRGLLAELCARSTAHAGSLSAAPDPSILLWYLCNGLTRALIVDGGVAIVFVTETEADFGTGLRVQEWLGPLPADPVPVLRTLLREPVAHIAFGFLPPAGWFGDGLHLAMDDGALLYWRAARPVPPGPLLFPELLAT